MAFPEPPPPYSCNDNTQKPPSPVSRRPLPVGSNVTTTLPESHAAVNDIEAQVTTQPRPISPLSFDNPYNDPAVDPPASNATAQLRRFRRSLRIKCTPNCGGLNPELESCFKTLFTVLIPLLCLGTLGAFVYTIGKIYQIIWHLHDTGKYSTRVGFGFTFLWTGVWLGIITLFVAICRWKTRRT